MEPAQHGRPAGRGARHAPNDLLMNFKAVMQAAQEACDKGKDQGCIDRYVDRHFVALPERMKAIAETHRRNVQRYASDYLRTPTTPPLAIDAGAKIFYLRTSRSPTASATTAPATTAKPPAASTSRPCGARALQQVCSTTGRRAARSHPAQRLPVPARQPAA